MELPFIITAAVLNSAVVYMLFIAALRPLSSTKVMSADLTSQLRNIVVRNEFIHLVTKVCILYLLPPAFTNMLNNSVAHIWILSLIQWYYVSNALEITYEQNSGADCTDPVPTDTEAKKMRKPSLIHKLSHWVFGTMTISPEEMRNIIDMMDSIKSTSEQHSSVSGCTEPVATNSEAEKIEKPSFANRFIFRFVEAVVMAPIVVSASLAHAIAKMELENMSKQDSDSGDIKLSTPEPAIKRDEQHVIEHWASVLSIWVILVYPTAAIISYHGLSVAHILITHVDLFVETNGAILLVFVWMAANILNPIFTSGAKIAKTVQSSIAV